MDSGALPPPIPSDGAAGGDVVRPAVVPHPLSRHGDLAILWISLAIIAWSLVLSVVGDRVAIFFLPRWPLPQMCASRRFLAIDCPACGLTRSFVHLAHGHWQAAWHCHRLGWLLALLTVLQIPYRLLALSGMRLLKPGEGRGIIWGLIAAFIVNWLAGFFV